MKHKFFKGFVIGTVSTVGAIAGSLFAFKKTVLDHIEEEEKKSKKIVVALTVNHSAHQAKRLKMMQTLTSLWVASFFVLKRAFQSCLLCFATYRKQSTSVVYSRY